MGYHPKLVKCQHGEIPSEGGNSSAPDSQLAFFEYGSSFCIWLCFIYGHFKNTQ